MASRVDPVERWRVFWPHEREALRAALFACDYDPAITRALGMSSLTRKQFDGILLKLEQQLNAVERRPRPKLPWWDRGKIKHG